MAPQITDGTSFRAVCMKCTYNTALCSHFGFVNPLAVVLFAFCPCISERLVLELCRLLIGIAMLRPFPLGDVDLP